MEDLHHPDKQEIIFSSYNVDVKDVSDEHHIEIRLWGLDRNSKPILCRVKDFYASFYLELPPIVGGKKKIWKVGEVKKIIEYYSFICEDEFKPISYSDIQNRGKLYYYQSEEDWTSTVHLKFRTENASYNFQRLLKNQKLSLGLMRHLRFSSPIIFQIHEERITTMRKFFTKIDGMYTQWMRVMGEILLPGDERRISLDGSEEFPTTEILVEYNNISPIPHSESEGWFCQPRILAFDIETYSDNHRKFPSEDNPNHVIFNISMIYQQLGKKETRKRTCLILGQCDDISNGDIECFSDEVKLIDRFAEIIRILDPDIITGYNILGFDNKYILGRLKISNINDIIPNMGRLREEPTIEKEIKWKSSGYGNNIITLFEIPGRITIDLLPLVRRSYKLPKYTLEVVSQFFLGRGKHDVTPKQMFEAFEENQSAINGGCPIRLKEARESMKKIVEYCVEDSELTIDLFEFLNIWYSLVEESAINGVTIMELFTRGQTVRVQSLIYHEAHKRGMVVDRKDKSDATYSGAHVFSPIAGLYDFLICLDFASLYPSIIRALNICFTTLVKHRGKLEDTDVTKIEFDQEEEIDPPKKQADEEDLSELYGDGDSKEFGTAKKSRKKKEVHLITKHYSYEWIKSEKYRGILPEIEDKLVSERSAVRKKLAEVDKLIKLIEKKDPSTKIEVGSEEYQRLKTTAAVLESRQLGLKCTANSVYGFLGNVLKEGASTVTAYGRILIHRVEKYLLEHKNANIVYGDTDSIMITLSGVDEHNCNQIGRDLAKEVSDMLNQPPLKMEFEKAMRAIIFKKKKYASYLYSDSGKFKIDKEGKKIMLYRGIPLARRDNCSWIRDTYYSLLINILDGNDIVSSFNIIVSYITRLVDGETSPKEVSVIKALGSDYKVGCNAAMKIFGEELNKMGKPIQPGERLEYVVVNDTDLRKKVGEKMRLLEDYIDSIKNNECNEKIDELYYVSKLLQNPIDQLFYTGYIKQLKDLSDNGNLYYYHPHKLPKMKDIKRVRNLCGPVKMIVNVIKDFYKFTPEEKEDFPKGVGDYIRYVSENIVDELRKI